MHGHQHNYSTADRLGGRRADAADVVRAAQTAILLDRRNDRAEARRS